MPAESRKGIRYAALKRIERIIVHAADRVILNTEPLYQDFCSYYQGMNTGKFLTIMNGIDPDDYPDPHPSSALSSGRFVITHGGTLYRKRDPRPFLRAISELVKERVISEEELVVQFIGCVDTEFSLHQWIRELDLEAVVRVEPPIPHEGYLKRLAASDLLLCIQPYTDLQIPSKLFEYMAVGKPVLVLAHDGATKEVINRYNRGKVVEPENVPNIKEAILELLRSEYSTDDNAEIQNKEIPQFSVVDHTRKLDEVLTGCLGYTQK